VGGGEPPPRVAPSRVPARARPLRWTRQRRGAAGAARRGLHAHLLGRTDARDGIGRSARVAGSPPGSIRLGAPSAGRVDRSGRHRERMARRPPHGGPRSELPGESLWRSVRAWRRGDWRWLACRSGRQDRPAPRYGCRDERDKKAFLGNGPSPPDRPTHRSSVAQRSRGSVSDRANWRRRRDLCEDRAALGIHEGRGISRR
jgi:hypothetical protein